MKKILTAVILLLLSIFSYGDEACAYPDKTEGFVHSEKCGFIEGDRINLNKSILDVIFYDNNSLACVMFSSKDVFYIHKNGASQRVHFFDNGCDYFEEGLARGIVNGKKVFINKELTVVLSPDFELLTHFDYGHSVVCNGPFQEEKQGEYRSLKGGRCGLIDKQGALVVKAVHPIGEREVFERYINSNNHCPAPPVNSKESALCHAKRHVSNMDYHTDQWEKYELSKQDGIWLITFIEKGKNSNEFTLSLNADSAQWESLIQASHAEALQKINH